MLWTVGLEQTSRCLGDMKRLRAGQCLLLGPPSSLFTAADEGAMSDFSHQTASSVRADSSLFSSLLNLCVQCIVGAQYMLACLLT